MAKGILIGDANASSTAGTTAESIALGYFIDRRLAGDCAPRPPVERWLPDQRKRFEAELKRLEDERASQMAAAVELAARRT